MTQSQVRLNLHTSEAVAEAQEEVEVEVAEATTQIVQGQVTSITASRVRKSTSSNETQHHCKAEFSIAVIANRPTISSPQ